MGIAFLHGNGGSGGGGLNFKVIPNPQPSTAKENTIWVNTDKINNYYFSATQPENMADYDVWFQTGTSSRVEFNTLKKNGIQVYPLSARQYNGGKLTFVDAMSYQNGEWVSWIPYLYNNGVGIEDFTLGTYTFESVISSAATDNGTYVKLTASGKTVTQYSPAGSIMTTKEKVDLSAYSWLKVRRKINAMTAPDYSGFYVFCGRGINTNGVIDDFIEGYLHEKTAPATTSSVVDINISSITEAVFIQIQATAQSTSTSNVDVDIYEIWFE